MLELDDNVERAGAAPGRPPSIGQLRRWTRKGRGHAAVLVLVAAAFAAILVLAITGINKQRPSTVGPGQGVAATPLDSLAHSTAPSGRDAQATQVAPELPKRISDTVPSPALTAPSTEPLCHADDIVYAPGTMGTALLRFFNHSGRPCALAGYANIVGLDEQGQWLPIPVIHAPDSPVSGPAWSGSFDPRLTMVVSIEPTTSCEDRDSVRRYSALRLILPQTAEAIDVPINATFTGCAPSITPFSYDSADE